MNDLAVELCKVSLWLETLEPRKPLSFLDHHIRVGNSLFGATPEAIEQGIPSDAFDTLTGDEPEVVKQLKSRNTKELKAGLAALTFGSNQGDGLADEIRALEEIDDDDVQSVRAKEAILDSWRSSPYYLNQKQIADAWCAAFSIAKDGHAPELTSSVFQSLKGGSISDCLLYTSDAADE